MTTHSLIILSLEQEQTLSRLMLTLNSISFVGSLFVLITHLIFKRKYPSSLVLYLSFSACLLSIFVGIGPMIGVHKVLNNDILCTLQGILSLVFRLIFFGFGIQFFESLIIWWFFSIAVNLYLIIVRKKVNTEWYEKYFLVLGWGVPIILSTTPLFARRYVTGRCWIATEYDGIWEFVCLYLEMIVLTLIALYLWSHVIFSAIQVSSMVKLPLSSQEYLFHHSIGVICFIVLFAFFILHRAYLLFHESIGAPYYYSLLIMHTISLSGQGLIVFFVYGFTRENIRLWKNFITGKNKNIKYQSINNSALYA